MIKVHVTNMEKRTEMLVKSLERENESLARAQLSAIKKNASSKLYYYEGKMQKEQPEGIDYQVLNSQINQAKVEKEQIDNAVEMIRDYISNPENYDYNTNRADLWKLQRAFQRINFIEEKKRAEKEVVRKAQSQAGDVVGITINTIRTSLKLNALLQNVVYNNDLFNIDEDGLIEISEKIKKMTGYDIMGRIINIFEQKQHYDSSGDNGSTPIYDRVKDITSELSSVMMSYSKDDLDELKDLVADVYAMFNVGG